MATTPERIEKAHHNQGRKPVNKLQVPIGQVFGFLTVLREAPSKKWMTMVERRCVCGGIVIKRLANLRNQHKKGVKPSCGCRGDPTHKEIIKHGGKSRPYRIWVGMKSRCNNPHSKDYRNYGARGIKVCDRWLEFNNFWEDMKSGYSPDKSLDRINPNGDYCKENCRWASVKEQANNRRLTIRDGDQTLSEISDQTGISYETLISRYSFGDRGERLRRPITKGDIAKRLQQQCEEAGVSLDTVQHRIKRGWPEERWFDPVKRRKF